MFTLGPNAPAAFESSASAMDLSSLAILKSRFFSAAILKQSSKESPLPAVPVCVAAPATGETAAAAAGVIVSGDVACSAGAGTAVAMAITVLFLFVLAAFAFIAGFAVGVTSSAKTAADAVNDNAIIAVSMRDTILFLFEIFILVSPFPNNIFAM
jgi:hypothetical protein